MLLLVFLSRLDFDLSKFLNSKFGFRREKSKGRPRGSLSERLLVKN
jgi:hypothetical protein